MTHETRSLVDAIGIVEALGVGLLATDCLAWSVMLNVKGHLGRQLVGAERVERGAADRSSVERIGGRD
jgi:hypothetical protein